MAIDRIETHSGEFQDAMAEQPLGELGNEVGWRKTADESHPKLRKLVRGANQQSDSGRTKKTGFCEV
jgi:hypothetical protein